MKQRINKKGMAPLLLVLVLILAFVLGYIIRDFNNLHSQIFGPEYFENIDIPNNVTKYEDVNIDIEITNPNLETIKPSLLITYNKDKWRTYNRYIKYDEKIDFDELEQGKSTTYSISFDSISQNKIGEYNFDFILYDENNRGEILENVSKTVKVRE